MGLENSPLLSVHIPKTGGISRKEFWNNLYGPENVLFYYPQNGNLVLYRSSNESKPLINNPILRGLLETKQGRVLYRLLPPQVRKRTPRTTTITDDGKTIGEAKVIHGHFHPKHFAQMLPGKNLTTVLREPLERVKSHFLFSVRKHELGRETASEYKPGMTFTEYALQENMQNFQAKFLKDTPLSDFAYVGVLDHLDRYCRIFNPEGRIQIQRLNRTQGKIEISDEFMRNFRKLNELDYQLYGDALSRSLQTPPVYFPTR